MDPDVKLAQLLCSRLCHDLVGPIGAVNAGLELMEEEVGDLGDAGRLARKSASQVTRRLAFFRIAFGFGGGAAIPIDLGEVRDLALGLLAEGTVGLDWPAAPAKGTPVPATAGKCLLNLLLVAVDALPRGGRIAVRLARLPEGVGVAITASGTGAQLRSDLRTALTPATPLDAVTARTIHALWAMRLAGTLGIDVEVAETANEVRLAVLLPGSGP